MLVLKNLTSHGERLLDAFLKIPADDHSYLLPLLMDMIPFTDDIHKRSASFITACLKSDSTFVRSVAEFGIIVSCCDSILGRNTLLCCSHFARKFDDFVCSSIDLSNGNVLRRHHKLVDSCDWHTVQFLSEITNVRDVFSLYFSDGFTLSRQELNSTVLFLATDRQT